MHFSNGGMRGSWGPLEEQISSGRQNSEHFRSRLTVLKDDLQKRSEEKEKLTEERASSLQ